MRDERLLSDLVRALESVAATDAVGVLCRPPNQLTRVQRWWARSAFPPVLRGPGPVPGISAVDWKTVGAACFGIRRATFARLGGFNERLLSAEDYELTYRLTRQGGRCFVLTEPRVVHAPPRTLAEAARKVIWHERGNAQLARAHPEARYRPQLRGPLQALAYLLARTAALPALCLLRVSYHHRRPAFAVRPFAALRSYLGAWAYCSGWLVPPRGAESPPDAASAPRLSADAAPVKVLYLVTGLHVGGAEKLVLHLTTHLDRRRYAPVVASLIGGALTPDFERAGIQVHDLRMRVKWDLGVLARLARVLRAERPAILHTHLVHADLLGRLVGRWCGVPIIVNTVHMIEPFRRGGLLQRLDRWTAARWSHGHAAVSEAVKQQVRAVEGLAADRITVIPNGIPRPPALSGAAQEAARAELGLAPGTPLIGIVSRLEARKGHHLLFAAMQLLGGRWPGLHCVVVGDGEERRALEAQARTLGLASRVTFLGTRHDVPRWLASLDIFLLPSLLEGAPMVLLEAMAAGVPIIATQVGGVPDLLEHETTALLVPAGETAALAAAIHQLLSDPLLARQLGDRARQEFARRFDAAITADRTEAWYDRLVQRRLVRRLKLLEVVTAFDIGGVTTYLAGFVRHLPPEQWEVTVASGPDGVQGRLLASLGVRYRQVPIAKAALRPARDLAALWQLYRLMRRERVDVVHTGMKKADLIAGLAARLAGVPVIVTTVHGILRLVESESLKQRLLSVAERLVLRWLPTQIISVCDATTRELLAKRKVAPARLATIRNGIDWRAVQAAGDRVAARRALGFDEGHRVVGMVARLRSPKTPQVLVRSLARLEARWPDLRTLFIGDGPDAAPLGAQVRLAGLGGRVRLLGDREDVPRLLSACDVFVLSTFSEGLPISILEAMAAGLPVVASDVGGIRELVDPGVTGLLVPPGDDHALAQALDVLLRQPELAAAMGRAGLRRVQDQFDVRRQAAWTRRLIERAVAAATHRRVPVLAPAARPLPAAAPQPAVESAEPAWR